MTPETARKIVVAAALVGTAAVVYQANKSGTPAATTYRKVWGLMLLVVGGSVLADFAPMIVGPYMALVLLGFLIQNKGGLGSLFGAAGSAAGSGAGATPAGGGAS